MVIGSMWVVMKRAKGTLLIALCSLTAACVTYSQDNVTPASDLGNQPFAEKALPSCWGMPNNWTPSDSFTELSPLNWSVIDLDNQPVARKILGNANFRMISEQEAMYFNLGIKDGAYYYLAALCIYDADVSRFEKSVIHSNISFSDSDNKEILRSDVFRIAGAKSKGSKIIFLVSSNESYDDYQTFSEIAS